MRNLAILVGALLAAGASTASAQELASAPPPVWQGDLFVKSVTSLCNGITSPGNFYRAVYRPHIAPPPKNQAAEALALNGQRSEFILEATGTTLRSKGAKANGTNIGSRAEVIAA